MSAATSSATQRNSFRFVLWSIAIATVGYLVLVAWQSGDQLRHAFAQVSGLGAAVIVSLSLANYALRYARWHWYLQRLGYRIPKVRGFQYYVAGFSFTTTPGKVGEALRSIYLKRHDVPYVQSLAMFFAERLSDLIAMVVLSALAIWQFPQYQALVAVMLALMTVVLALFQSRIMRVRATRRITVWSRGRGRFGTSLRGGLALLTAAIRLLRPRMLAGGLAISLLAWAAEGTGFYFILHYLHLDLPLSIAVGIYSISVLIGAISFLPGGLGSTEAVMILLLLLAGASHPTAIAATLICRIATLWFAVGLGGIALMSITGQAAVTKPADPSPT